MPPFQGNPNGPATTRDIADLARFIAGGNFPWWMVPEVAGQAVDPFIYALEVLPLGANGTANGKITVESDSAFYLVAQTAVATEPDDPSTIIAQPPVMVNIKDAGAGRLLSSQSVHLLNQFGTAQLPYFHAIPRLWAPASSITVELQNLGSVAIDLRLAFHGIKIYNFTASPRR